MYEFLDFAHFFVETADFSVIVHVVRLRRNPCFASNCTKIQ